MNTSERVGLILIGLAITGVLYGAYLLWHSGHTVWALVVGIPFGIIGAVIALDVAESVLGSGHRERGL